MGIYLSTKEFQLVIDLMAKASEGGKLAAAIELLVRNRLREEAYHQGGEAWEKFNRLMAGTTLSVSPSWYRA